MLLGHSVLYMLIIEPITQPAEPVDVIELLLLRRLQAAPSKPAIPLSPRTKLPTSNCISQPPLCLTAQVLAILWSRYDICKLKSLGKGSPYPVPLLSSPLAGNGKSENHRAGAMWGRSELPTSPSPGDLLPRRETAHPQVGVQREAHHALQATVSGASLLQELSLYQD